MVTAGQLREAHSEGRGPHNRGPRTGRPLWQDLANGAEERKQERLRWRPLSLQEPPVSVQKFLGLSRQTGYCCPGDSGTPDA